MNSIEQINTAVDTFDKYGLPGLVILACFISLWALIRFMKTMNDEHLELYEKQGELFFDAFIQSYELYKSEK